MTATDDRPTLHELKTFAQECDEAADRLYAQERERPRLLLRTRRDDGPREA